MDKIRGYKCWLILLIIPWILAFEYGGDLPFPPETCSLEFKNADVKNVLRSLVKPYKINLLVSESVKGTVTASFKDVYIKDVFLTVLKDAGLNYVKQGDIIQVDYDENLKKKSALITKTFQLNYSFDSTQNKDLTKLSTELQRLLSKRQGASMTVVPQNNTLIVTDIQENLDKIARMIEELDVVSPQVVIMSNIVELDSTYVKDIGVQWGTKLGAGKSTPDPTDPTKTDSTVTLQGTKSTGTGRSGERFMVDLPAAAGPGAGGAVNLIIGKIGKNLLDMQLSAMEQLGTGKTLANPKVITQNNQAAKIESGFEIPYQVVGEGGAYQVAFKSAVISLDVTPHVIGKKIFMDLVIHKDSPDFSRQVGASAPPIKTSRLTTKVLVENGETVVIGGLVTEDKPETESRVPFFADIPIIGWMFRHKNQSDTKKELMIFVTPTTLERG